MDDLTWRPARPSDAANLLELFQAINRTTPIGLETDLAEVESRLSRPGLDLERDTFVGVAATGAALGYAETADMGVGQGQLRIRLTHAPHPELADAAARQMQEWQLERARSLRRERRPDLPAVLGTRCAALDASRLTLLTEAGFQVVGGHQDLIRTVDEPTPTPATPPGVTITHYEDHQSDAALVAHNDAYADSPNALLPDPQGWPQHAVGLPSFRPEASFLALADTADGPSIAAFVFSLEHRDPDGTREGVLECLGTRPQWRRLGLASALIGQALAAYRLAGFARARLQVNTTNTDAVNLYRKLGFIPSGRGYSILQAPLD
ncbi:GNAT family N-acetyltransferase [Plantactinospora siamensis]|uniref:GNAT family N-acetyltransferase n=1 Tax=Plantactinospora siamensis TaxID=555372 RepID=A0ABV6NWT3_9ACTN